MSVNMLKDKITVDEIKKIFPNKDFKWQYLKSLYASKKINNGITKPPKDINQKIIESWDYDVSKDIIRKLFYKTEKYKRCKNSALKLEKLISSWKKKKLGKLDWPFQAMAFDQHIHQLNNSNKTESEKDKIIKTEVVKFRRMKDITAKRNDYIEYLLFEKCEDLIPTLTNRNGVDYYIHGLPYDQKVSRSVSKKFIEQYKDNYREKAIDNPNLVGKYLYEYQDGERFGDEARLFVVYLDNDLSLEDLKNSLSKVDLNEPFEIEFEYPQSDKSLKAYKTTCYVILLYSEEKTN